MISALSALLKNDDSKLHIYKLIFQLWIITFPFGSMILSISLGFFTLYPYLMLLMLLLAFSFFFKTEKRPLFSKVALSFFGIFFLYALILGISSWHKSYSLFDLRNIALFVTTIYLLHRSSEIMGWKETKRILGDIFALFFIIFTLIAAFELFTGIHIKGLFTQKLTELAVTSTTYNPIFIFDNPNNFITYYLIIGVVALLLNQTIRDRFGLSTLIMVLILAFSIFNNSRFGEISSFLMLLEIFILHFKPIFEYSKKHCFALAIILGLAILTFASNPLYFGPIWEKSDKYIENSIMLVQTESPYNVVDHKSLDTCKNKQEIVTAFKNHRTTETSLGSDAVRSKLIKNGLYLFANSNGLGVGPGMYRYYHDQKQIPNNVVLQNGPHNWTIELVSQYGIIGILYLLLFTYMTVVSILSIKKAKDSVILFLFSTLIFFIMSNSPSAFGLLDINWIFTGIILLFFTNEILKTDNIEHKTE